MKTNYHKAEQFEFPFVSPSPSASDRLSKVKVMCPIYDKNWKPMNVGDRFKYQPGTPYESIATIELRDGVEWLRWNDGSPEIRLEDFWYASTDRLLSLWFPYQ